MLTDKRLKWLSTATISLWLILFVLLPCLLVVVTSFLTAGNQQLFVWHLTLKNYRVFFSLLYVSAFIHSIFLALQATLLCLIIAYPFTFVLVCMGRHMRSVLLLLMIIPFWTSSLIRSYAIIAIIQANGLLNHFLLKLGIIHHPLVLLYTHLAVLLGLVYSLLPFMILPLYTNMIRIDWHLLEVAKDLGANPYHCLRWVIFPLTIPGIISGIIFVFFPAMTLFFIPDLLGGARSLLLGNLIRDEFLLAHNWPMGSATSVLLVILMLMIIGVSYRFIFNRNGRLVI